MTGWLPPYLATSRSQADESPPTAGDALRARHASRVHPSSQGLRQVRFTARVQAFIFNQPSSSLLLDQQQRRARPTTRRYKLQPIYTFGEADTYTAFTGLLRLRLWINTLGMPAVLFWGAHFFPLLPRTSSRVLSYVGEPIQMPRIPHPTSEELDTWHGRYVDALVRTFEENKAEAGYPNATLELW